MSQVDDTECSKRGIDVNVLNGTLPCRSPISLHENFFRDIRCSSVGWEELLLLKFIG